MKNNEKKQLTFADRNLIELRKEMNLVTEEELKAKGYECVFSNKTHKLKSIKKTSKKEVGNNDERWEMKFNQLIEDVEKWCHVKISLSESKRLRSFYIITDIPKPKRKPNAKKSKEQNNVVSEQTESIAA